VSVVGKFDVSEIVNVDGPSDVIGERDLSRLKWRCRRGLLENDIFIARFFVRFESRLTTGQAQALGDLMDLSDNDLLDLHLGRKPLSEVDTGLDRNDVQEVLSMLRETR
jgi:antitoxin CptB